MVKSPSVESMSPSLPDPEKRRTLEEDSLAEQPSKTYESDGTPDIKPVQDDIPIGETKTIEIIEVAALIQIMVGMLFLIFCVLGLLMLNDPTRTRQVLPPAQAMHYHLVEGGFMIFSGCINKFAEPINRKTFGLRYMPLVVRIIAIIINFCLGVWNVSELFLISNSKSKGVYL